MWSFKQDIYKSSREDINPCPDCIAGDITIGSQVWTKCNATVTKYSDNSDIPQVTDPLAWSALTTGAWCWYNNDPANEAIYGKLYNWHAVNDPRGLAPAGYHIPTDTELVTLTTFLGGTSVAGGAMKEVGLCHWNTPNTDATNTSFFTGLGGGARSSGGNYGTFGNFGNWWTSTEVTSTNRANSLYLSTGSGIAGLTNNYKYFGFSVRFIMD
jgi:uncharacterized protein (TIGR02145 family)